MKCDLHLHTNCSDGAFSPEEIVQLAKKQGLDLIAITDHDTVSGVARAVCEGKTLGVCVIPAIEVSSVFDGLEVHILGYNLNLESPTLQTDLQSVADLRNNRNRALVEKLCDGGFEISLLDIEKQAKGSVGRPDIAKELVKKGFCKNVAEAFDKFIGKGKPFYVQTERLTPKQAIEFIHKNGGVAVLAHPKNLHLSHKKMIEFVGSLVESGLSGIEAEYFTHTKAERRYYFKMAKRFGLAVTGGSDFHDKSHGAMIGSRSFDLNSFSKRILKIV